MKMAARLMLSMVCSMGMMVPAWADNFWEEHAKGWHWYEDPTPMETHEETNASTPDPSVTLDNLQQYVKRALAQAILNPTPDHMRRYITLQNQISEQARRFALAWQAALLNNPGLDYSLSHPTNSVGKQVYLSQQKQQEDQAIALLAKHSGLFFFYRSTCPYCQRFAPIVKDFSERYGIAVIAITTDGAALSAFPHSYVDHGQATRFKINVEPALFTVDPYHQRIIPVGYGLMSEDELRSRILAIATQSNELNEATP